MTTRPVRGVEIDEIDEAAVASYLAATPEFFDRHAQLQHFTLRSLQFRLQLLERGFAAVEFRLDVRHHLHAVDHKVGDQTVDLSALHDHADQTCPTQVALAELRAGEVLVVEASHADRLSLVQIGGTSHTGPALMQNSLPSGSAMVTLDSIRYSSTAPRSTSSSRRTPAES